MSEIGILLRNNNDNNTFAVDKNGWMNSVQLNRYRTAYLLYWKEVKSVQVGNKRIMSPDMKHIPFTLSNLTLKLSIFMNYIDTENLTQVFTDICNKYNSQ